jgi:glutamate racemase
MIGVFDSGVGGLSVLREARRLLPDADLLYAADRARAPFGIRSLREVEAISHEISEWLIDEGADCLVVACNTASAAALESIRAAHPGLPVVGMEPAVKPAAASTATGTVAVYATEATFQGRLFDSVVRRFASGVEVLTRACPEWVDLTEAGQIDGPAVEQAVKLAVRPAREANADRIVLACTHFSFLTPVIEEVARIPVIDPAPAVAAQLARVAPNPSGSGQTVLAASGDGESFRLLAREVAGISASVIPLPL